MNEIGVFADMQEIDLFFKRYDKNRDGSIRFSEFCDAIVPVDPYYGAMVNRRTSNSVYLRNYDPRDAVF